MPVFNNIYAIQLYLALFLSIVFLVSAEEAAGDAKKPLFNDYQRTIVLDPGHGGRNSGSKGPSGTYEKTVTLTLARMIASELGGKYKVILTRTDDYGVDISSRTSTANHLKADIFISIHAGGSFLHTAGGLSTFYYQRISESALMIKPETIKSLESRNIKAFWDDIQNQYIEKSRDLARLIQKSIQDQRKYLKCETQGAPLLVLTGADMPAILIEIGYLTNPAEEKALRNLDFLSDLAKGIANGIV
ncbi:MAG: N-acetylmuramoyl-L-alanine amidase, partial [Deltaproteobacteria bacterium]|nr:N-acetylmuramoyl-L-alanine amidase [Deltaproteobacteria bacterium]